MRGLTDEIVSVNLKDKLTCSLKRIFENTCQTKLHPRIVCWTCKGLGHYSRDCEVNNVSSKLNLWKGWIKRVNPYNWVINWFCMSVLFLTLSQMCQLLRCGRGSLNHKIWAPLIIGYTKEYNCDLLWIVFIKHRFGEWNPY